jgi:hypothetical protein
VLKKVVCIVRGTIQVLTRATLAISAKGQDLVKAPVKEKVTFETVIGSAVVDAIDRFHGVTGPNRYRMAAKLPMEKSGVCSHPLVPEITLKSQKLLLPAHQG